jgi:Druantia protein DruA
VDQRAASLLRRLTLITSSVRKCRSKEELQAIFIRRSRERARRHRDWLAQRESLFLRAIALGRQVDPDRVQPVLHIVTSQEQRDLFRFARFTSSIPFTDRVGRRIRFLIRDASLPNQPLMGIAALGSPVLDLGPRDAWIFGQNTVPRERRQQRLGCLSELYVAVGLRPYSELLAGKLICYCVATREVVEAYNAKYARSRRGQSLAVIYSLSAYGPRSSQYNRLSIRGRLMFRRIGVTKGWSVSHIPDCLAGGIRSYLENKNISIHSTLPRKDPSKFHLVHRFLRHAGIRPERIFYTGIHRGIYVCPVAKNFQSVVQALAEPEYDVPSLGESIQWWRQRWLYVRARNAEVMRRVRAFCPDTTYSVRVLCGETSDGRVVPASGAVPGRDCPPPCTK